MTTNYNNNNNINPRPCVYNCGIQIYWNSTVNEYWEVFTKKKHICPNRGQKSSTTIGGLTTPSNAPKPYYYNSKRKASFSATPKPKMSNSFELLQGPSIDIIQRKYEILSDIVTEYNGNSVVHKGIEILKLV